MTAYYDLHIHSCLSPCASDDMTPANIAGMASIKGLSLIALTDHNCGCNLMPMAAFAAQFGLVFVPGIEVTTLEEVHVLAYFAKTADAAGFGELLYDSLPNIVNRPEIFGRQLIMDIDDCPSGELEKLLLQATPFSIDEISKMVRKAGGCTVPAHINRPSFSVLSNLGFIPPNLFGAVEVTKDLSCPSIDPSLYRLHSSDAHALGDIAEPAECLDSITKPADFVDLFNSIPNI